MPKYKTISASIQSEKDKLIYDYLMENPMISNSKLIKQALNYYLSHKIYNHDIVNDKPVYIRKLQYVNGVLSVDVGLFNRSNSRITRLTGSTGAKSGYCYYSSEAVSNTNPDRELKFVDNISQVVGTVLFQYRII